MRLAQRDAGMALLWDRIHRTAHWDVVHSYNTSLLGWVVLVTRTHRDAIDELTEEEALELGVLIRKVSIALKELTGCVKTYVMQFAEDPSHPHVRQSYRTSDVVRGFLAIWAWQRKRV